MTASFHSTPIRRTLCMAAVLTLGFCALPQPLIAQQSPPALIDYQGRLTDLSGNPLGGVNGANYTVEFRIYGEENGTAAPLWGEKQTFTVRNGEFSVRLGEGIAIAGVVNNSLLNAFDGNTRYLGVTVANQGGEILPRLAFLSTPFAIVAQKAITATALNQTAGITTTNALTVAGQTKINGTNAIEFGSGVAGKSMDAGKIGYGTFTPNALNIVGAGSALNGSDRKLFIYSEGGTTIQGPLSVTGLITGNGGGITNLNASQIATGTLPAARLPAEVPQLNLAQTFTADQSIASPASLSFGNSVRQMINLWGTSYGMGVQDSTLYARSGGGFAWYLGGVHDNAANSAGAGGRRALAIDGTQVTVGNNYGDNFGLYVRGANGLKIESQYAGSWSIYHADGGGGADLRFKHSNDANFWYYNASGQSGRTSDIALKKDVVSLEPALDRVLALRPVTFRFKQSAEDTPKVTGFIAQEVEPLFPDLVSNHDGFKGVAENDMIPITVSAIQEEHRQRTEIDAIQNEEVKTLKKENAALLKRLEALEKLLGADPQAATGIK